METVKFRMEVLWSFLLPAILLLISGCSEALLEEADENYLKSAPQVSNGAAYHPWEGEADICDGGSFCLVAGQFIDVGILYGAYDNDGNLYLGYFTTGGWYLKEVHLFVGHNAEDIPTNKKNHPMIGHFPYQVVFDPAERISRHAVMLENPHVGTEFQYGCNDLVIAAHAVVAHETEGEETAWGMVCEGHENGFISQRFADKGTWATFLTGELCMQPCMVDYSYAWEDLQDEGNDQDYNDFVVQSIIWKQLDDGLKTYMKFIAKARGAGYDHKLYIALVDDGTVTVFPSTQNALPGGVGGWAYNTLNPCNPLDFAEETIILDGDYTDPLSFMPVITVYPSGSYLNPAGSYDLNIWELAVQMGSPFGATYTVDGLSYPNGLVVPGDWKWPMEYLTIGQAYEDFMDVASWDADWYTNLSDASLVWDPENADCD